MDNLNNTGVQSREQILRVLCGLFGICAYSELKFKYFYIYVYCLEFAHASQCVQ